MPLLVIIGYGPGNGHAIARRFGLEGWTIALVARSDDALESAVAALGEEGISAHAYAADASRPDSLQRAFARIRSDLGSIRSIALSAYRSIVVDDVLTVDPREVTRVFDIGVAGLVAAVQAGLDDLRSTPGASVLVVNGGLGRHDDGVDAFAVSFGGDGVALECAAKTKLVGLLAARLRADDVYVGEIVINGSLRGAPHASPTAIDPADVAARLWDMAEQRLTVHVEIAEAS